MQQLILTSYIIKKQAIYDNATYAYNFLYNCKELQFFYIF